MKFISLLVACCYLIPFSVRAQDQNIRDYLDAYIGTNAKPYIQPLADMFTANINTGVWEWSQDHSGFYLRIKAQAIVSYPTEQMRTFQGKTTGDFKPPQTVTAPTVIGDRNGVVLQGEDTTFFIFPGGYELKRLTLGTPQITVGDFLHSEVSGRFLSFSLGPDIGKVKFLGIGARHFLSDYFEEPSFDFSIGYFYHYIQAGGYLKSNQHLWTASIGKSIKNLSGQLTFGYQTSDSDIHYTYTDEDGPYNVDLSMENKNNWITEASLGFRLGNVFVFGAASYAKAVSISGGAGLSF